MSPLRARLRHTVEIQRAIEGARNEYGIPSSTWHTLAVVRGWVQPVARREVTEDSEGGALRADYRLFMLPTSLTEADRIVWEGQPYRITNVLNPAGKDHHLEVGLTRVTVQ